MSVLEEWFIMKAAPSKPLEVLLGPTSTIGAAIGAHDSQIIAAHSLLVARFYRFRPLSST